MTFGAAGCDSADHIVYLIISVFLDAGIIVHGVEARQTHGEEEPPESVAEFSQIVTRELKRKKKSDTPDSLRSGMRKQYILFQAIRYSISNGRSVVIMPSSVWTSRMIYVRRVIFALRWCRLVVVSAAAIACVFARRAAYLRSLAFCSEAYFHGRPRIPAATEVENTSESIVVHTSHTYRDVSSGAIVPSHYHRHDHFPMA